MQSKDISTMSSYLMMLYVTLEQESALKNFFLGQGWTFCKPDLSVTTDKLGPSTLKQIGQNQLEPYLETPVAPIYNKKRKPKSSKSKETPPLKQQKSAQKQQSNDELEEVGNVVEGEAVGSEAKETRLGQSSGAENRPGSSRSVVLEDGREVTVKIEADFSESDNNEDGESELKDNDDDVNDNLDDDNDETDVDYNFLEEGEIRLKNEDMSLPAGSQSGESSLLDHLHGDSIEDQSMLEDSLNNETKVEDGAKIKMVKGRKFQKPRKHEKKLLKSYSHVCEFCSQVYKTKGILDRHRKQHLNYHMCRKCRKPFADEESLNRHKLEGHPLKHKCPVCEKAFETKQRYREHLETHSEVKSFICSYPGCDKQFARKDYLSEHMNYHTGECPYKCSRCDKQFKTRRTHYKHEKNCGNFIQCKECGKLMSPQSLTSHMDCYHGDDINFNCQWCGMGFKYRAGLARHKVKCTALKEEIVKQSTDTS